MKTLRQSIGIDVSQKELVVSLAMMEESGEVKITASKKFSNDEPGFTMLQDWSEKFLSSGYPKLFVMEATGVYHEKLAYWLVDNGHRVSVVVARKICNYFKTLEIKTTTDKTSSQVIARFGVERKLDLWQKPNKVYKPLKQLTRERSQLIEERTVIKNHMHAERAEADCSEDSIERMGDRIMLVNKQIKEIEKDIAHRIKTDKEVKRQVECITTITGVAQLTAATVLGETDGFNMIRNKKQLVSYAGLDVKEKQSGTSIKGKPRISKNGNKNLRKAMHFPALTAIRHDERMKAVYARLISKHGIKMKAAVAVQRKMLELIYTIWKKETTYDPNYFKTSIKELEPS